MSYDELTTTCYMSGKSWFINIPGKEPAAFMKEAHADTLTGLYYFTIEK